MVSRDVIRTVDFDEGEDYVGSRPKERQMNLGPRGGARTQMQSIKSSKGSLAHYVQRSQEHPPSLQPNPRDREMDELRKQVHLLQRQVREDVNLRNRMSPSSSSSSSSRKEQSCRRRRSKKEKTISKPMVFIGGVIALHRGSCFYFLQSLFFYGSLIHYFLLTSIVYVFQSTF